MDNAIEACDAFPAGHKPSISCTLRQKNHVLLYEISNPIPQVSVKKAGDIHGYGLENVKECVNRNSGFISVKNILCLYNTKRLICLKSAISQAFHPAHQP